ncbi:VanZ family protein [Halapricum desulfuricans]|uniref:VanZ like family protein n=1 Tax=Halapricum desulfuricans TaxID=2841257 RepID=A0A897N3H5_9EURY|nr:VanZ family protein [Halapricum desulfuricans]QSG05659.1 VanZ like family protein [Halapricum desulfuricans]
MSVRVPLLPTPIRWAAVLVVAGVVFYGSILAIPPETALDRARLAIVPLDKWRHFLAYGALAYALAYATADWERRAGRLAALVVAATVLYGIGIELGQSLTPDRHFSVLDAYADVFGAALVLPWYLLSRRLEFVPLRQYTSRETE